MVPLLEKYCKADAVRSLQRTRALLKFFDKNSRRRFKHYNILEVFRVFRPLAILTSSTSYYTKDAAVNTNKSSVCRTANVYGGRRSRKIVLYIQTSLFVLFLCKKTKATFIVCCKELKGLCDILRSAHADIFIKQDMKVLFCVKCCTLHVRHHHLRVGHVNDTPKLQTTFKRKSQIYLVKLRRGKDYQPLQESFFRSNSSFVRSDWRFGLSSLVFYPMRITIYSRGHWSFILKKYSLKVYFIFSCNFVKFSLKKISFQCCCFC